MGTCLQEDLIWDSQIDHLAKILANCCSCFTSSREFDLDGFYITVILCLFVCFDLVFCLPLFVCAVVNYNFVCVFVLCNMQPLAWDVLL